MSIWSGLRGLAMRRWSLLLLHTQASPASVESQARDLLLLGLGGYLDQQGERVPAPLNILNVEQTLSEIIQIISLTSILLFLIIV